MTFCCHVGAALEHIVERAMASTDVKREIFEGLHCVHCGSVNPAEWIAKHKAGLTRKDWLLAAGHIRIMIS